MFASYLFNTMIPTNQFKTLIQLLDYFDTEEKCLEHLENMRWSDGVIVSPFDKDSTVYRLAKPFKYKCRNTNKYFNVKTGTIFEDTKIKLRYWFGALYLLSCHKKGISSHQLGRDLGVTQKTAWFISNRLRYGLQHEQYKGERFGVFEADEAYIGGKEGNKHLNKKDRKDIVHGRANKKKAVVLGVIERGGEVVAVHTPNANREYIVPMITNNIKAGSTLYTDEYYAYSYLPIKLDHDTVKHRLKEYVKGNTHTNTIENYWSVLKRVIYGTYHQVSHKHLQKYLNECAYRFNTRDAKANERFNLYLCRVEGRLKYHELTANTDGKEKTTSEKRRYTRKEYRN
jgi:transposase-like protein